MKHCHHWVHDTTCTHMILKYEPSHELSTLFKLWCIVPSRPFILSEKELVTSLKGMLEKQCFKQTQNKNPHIMSFQLNVIIICLFSWWWQSVHQMVGKFQLHLATEVSEFNWMRMLDADLSFTLLSNLLSKVNYWKNPVYFGHSCYCRLLSLLHFTVRVCKVHFSVMDNVVQ